MLKSILRYFEHDIEGGDFFERIADTLSSGVLLPPTTGKLVLEGTNGGRFVFKGKFEISNGEVVGGKITGFKAFIDGKKVMKASNYDLSFADFQAALDEGSEATLMALITADETIGSNGDDYMFGISKILRGLDGDDLIVSSFGTKTLEGGDGDDILLGGLGSDNVYGGKGRDTFGFLTSADGVDKFRDFDVKKDKIAFNEGEFFILGDSIDPGEFGLGEAAETPDQHIIYNAGKLYWDSDGLGGDEQVLLAKLPKGSKLLLSNLDVDSFL